MYFPVKIILGLILVLFCTVGHTATVLMYHDINSDTVNQWSVTPDQFAKQMKYLNGNNFEVVHLNQIDVSNNNQVIITFDDGYASFIKHAWPLVKKYNFPVTINLVGKWVGGVIPHHESQKALTWRQVRMLDKTGLVKFGYHSYDLHHFHNDGVVNATLHEFSEDIRKFQNLLISHLGHKTNILAWPFGEANDEVVTVGQNFGFKYFQTMIPGRVDNLYWLQRVSIKQNVNFAKTLEALK